MNYKYLGELATPKGIQKIPIGENDHIADFSSPWLQADTYIAL
jgi:hypothetical protein